MTKLGRAAGWVTSMAALALGATGSYAHDETGTTEPVALAPGYTALQYPSPVVGSYELPFLGSAKDGAYIDSFSVHGRLHQLFHDRVTVLSFIYTQCKDVNGCPLATFVMGQIARRLQSDPEIQNHLRLVSFSFDIKNDSAETLQRYAASFRPDGVDWRFVTAPGAASLATTLAGYQQSVQETEGHAFAHILRVFLIDSKLRIRNIYSTSFLHTDTVASDIKTVLLENDILESKPNSLAATRPSPSATRTNSDARLGLPPAKKMNGPEPTAKQAALGRRLFFDRRLSLNRTISCAMCHIPAQGFAANELATAVGIEGRTVKRNAPTLLNVGFLTNLFHDARENRLEQQVWSPLLAHNEMANPSIGYLINNLKRWPEYRGLFETAFGTGPSMTTVGQALAAYERTLVAAGSDFDRYYYGNDPAALSETAQRGFDIFEGKGRCTACHTINDEYALFTDQALHNTGLGYLHSMSSTDDRRDVEIAPGTPIQFDLTAVAASSEPPPNDLGRYEVTEDPADRWKFRTPSLRNVALTGPYMHNGSLSTLEDVVTFYDQGGIPNDLLDPLIQPLGLTETERADLKTFLESLTSPALETLSSNAQ